MSRQPRQVRERLQILFVVPQAIFPLTVKFGVGIRLKVRLNVALAILVFYHMLQEICDFFKLVVAVVPKAFINL